MCKKITTTWRKEFEIRWANETIKWMRDTGSIQTKYLWFDDHACKGRYVLNLNFDNSEYLDFEFFLIQIFQIQIKIFIKLKNSLHKMTILNYPTLHSNHIFHDFKS